MADVKWIKIITDIFNDEKMLMIEGMPEADAVIVIWFKLLCLAGRTNNHGVLLMNDRIAYTEEMLSMIFRKPQTVIRMALQVFEQFGMIEIIDGVITIPNWEKHQSLDALEKKREYDRERMRIKRNEQKMIAQNNMSCDCSTTVAPQSKSKKENKKEIESIYTSDDIDAVISSWNSLSVYGIKPISKIASGSKRKESLVARITQYSVGEVLEAIEKIKNSDFLQGKTKAGFLVSFDWFVRPNNFPKVLEGNYDNRPTAEPVKVDRYAEVDSWV